MNRLTGEIPSEMDNLTNVTELDLSGNQLTGEIPRSFTSLTSLTNFFFSHNAGLCAPTDEPFQTWLQAMQNAIGYPCDFAADRAVLVTLYDTTDGANWVESSNWLSDRPMGSWYGVTTDNSGRVTELRLAENQLSGQIPAELGDLTNLSSLYLSTNRLTGCIPAALRSVVSNDFDEVALPFCGVPTVAVSPESESYRVRINSPIPVTVTFSEPVNGFSAGDVSVANGDVSSFSGSDGDSVFTFDVTPNAIGVVTVGIAEGVAQDSDGNGNTAAVQLTLGLPYDDDHDGAISATEVLMAVADYFNDRLSAQHVLQVVALYFASSG